MAWLVVTGRRRVERRRRTYRVAARPFSGDSIERLTLAFSEVPEQRLGVVPDYVHHVAILSRAESQTGAHRYRRGERNALDHAQRILARCQLAWLPLPSAPPERSPCACTSVQDALRVQGS